MAPNQNPNPPYSSSGSSPADTGGVGDVSGNQPIPGAPIPGDNRDPQVLVYIAGLVYLKMGSDVSPEDAKAEIDKLYDQFQNEVFNLAYDQLDSEKQQKLKDIVDGGGSQTEIQQFVLENIPDFQRQLEELIRSFQAEYTGSAVEEAPVGTTGTTGAERVAGADSRVSPPSPPSDDDKLREA